MRAYDIEDGDPHQHAISMTSLIHRARIVYASIYRATRSMLA